MQLTSVATTPAPYVPKAYEALTNSLELTTKLADSAHHGAYPFPNARDLSDLTAATREARAGAELAMSIDHFQPGLGGKVTNLAAQAVYVLSTATYSADRATFAGSLDFAASKLSQAIEAMDAADVVRPLPYAG